MQKKEDSKTNYNDTINKVSLMFLLDEARLMMEKLDHNVHLEIEKSKNEFRKSELNKLYLHTK